MTQVTNKIRILGASTSAKRSNAGNDGHSPAIVSLGMEGGVAKVRLTVFNDTEGLKSHQDGKDGAIGHATFRLERDGAIALIEELTKMYGLNQEQISVRERLTTPVSVDIAGAMLGKSL